MHTQTKLLVTTLLFTLPTALALNPSSGVVGFEQAGLFLEQLFESTYGIFSILVVVLTMLFYNLYQSLLSKVKIFSGDKGVNTYGKVVALCLGLLSSIGLFAGYYIAGANTQEVVRKTLKPFSYLIGFCLGLLFYALFYFGLGSASNDPRWKRGMMGAALAFLLVGSLLSTPMLFALGLPLLFASLMFMFTAKNPIRTGESGSQFGFGRRRRSQGGQNYGGGSGGFGGRNRGGDGRRGRRGRKPYSGRARARIRIPKKLLNPERVPKSIQVDFIVRGITKDDIAKEHPNPDDLEFEFTYVDDKKNEQNVDDHLSARIGNTGPYPVCPNSDFVLKISKVPNYTLKAFAYHGSNIYTIEETPDYLEVKYELGKNNETLDIVFQRDPHAPPPRPHPPTPDPPIPDPVNPEPVVPPSSSLDILPPIDLLPDPEDPGDSSDDHNAIVDISFDVPDDFPEANDKLVHIEIDGVLPEGWSLGKSLSEVQSGVQVGCKTDSHVEVTIPHVDGYTVTATLLSRSDLKTHTHATATDCIFDMKDSKQELMIAYEEKSDDGDDDNKGKPAKLFLTVDLPDDYPEDADPELFLSFVTEGEQDDDNEYDDRIGDSESGKGEKVHVHSGQREYEGFTTAQMIYVGVAPRSNYTFTLEESKDGKLKADTSDEEDSIEWEVYPGDDQTEIHLTLKVHSAAKLTMNIDLPEDFPKDGKQKITVLATTGKEKHYLVGAMVAGKNLTDHEESQTFEENLTTESKVTIAIIDDSKTTSYEAEISGLKFSDSAEGPRYVHQGSVHTWIFTMNGSEEEFDLKVTNAQPIVLKRAPPEVLLEVAFDTPPGFADKLTEQTISVTGGKTSVIEETRLKDVLALTENPSAECPVKGEVIISLPKLDGFRAELSLRDGSKIRRISLIRGKELYSFALQRKDETLTITYLPTCRIYIRLRRDDQDIADFDTHTDIKIANKTTGEENQWLMKDVRAHQKSHLTNNVNYDTDWHWNTELGAAEGDELEFSIIPKNASIGQRYRFTKYRLRGALYTEYTRPMRKEKSPKLIDAKLVGKTQVELKGTSFDVKIPNLGKGGAYGEKKDKNAAMFELFIELRDRSQEIIMRRNKKGRIVLED